TSEGSPDASFLRMVDWQRALAGVVLQDPDGQALASFIGADGTNPTTNSGRLNITLKPRSQRSASAAEIIARLQPRVADVEGVQLFLQPVQDLQIETRTSRTQFQYTLEDANPAELAEYGTKVLQKLQTLPELRDVTSDLTAAGLQEQLNIDRETAAAPGHLA